MNYPKIGLILTLFMSISLHGMEKHWEKVAKKMFVLAKFDDNTTATEKRNLIHHFLTVKQTLRAFEEIIQDEFKSMVFTTGNIREARPSFQKDQAYSAQPLFKQKNRPSIVINGQLRTAMFTNKNTNKSSAGNLTFKGIKNFEELPLSLSSFFEEIDLTEIIKLKPDFKPVNNSRKFLELLSTCAKFKEHPDFDNEYIITNIAEQGVLESNSVAKYSSRELKNIWSILEPAHITAQIQMLFH